MRKAADEALIRAFMGTIGAKAGGEIRLYFAGGATAVLFGWRQSTIDVDIRMVPEDDSVYRAIPEIKESLRVNVELASPADFLPEVPGWEDRSRFIETRGRVSFYHYDLYAQALAKVERGHARDLSDVEEMLRRGLVESALAWFLFQEIESELYRFPSVDPPSFKGRMRRAFGPPNP
jgi:hypothetical protein